MEKDFLITGINRIIMVGKEEYPDDFTEFSGKTEYNELIFHFSGQSTVHFGDSVLPTKPGTIRFLPKGDFSRYTVTRHERGECILVCFSADRPLCEKAFVMTPENHEQIGNYFKKIFSCWLGKNDGYYFECMSLLYKIFSLIQNTTYLPEKHFLKIKPAIDEIHQKFLSENLTIGKLCSLCSVSESYLTRLFKEKFGISPKKYIIMMRLNQACELLRYEHYSITQIADICGFSNVYFFSRQFKNAIGLTPTQFAKKYKSSK